MKWWVCILYQNSSKSGPLKCDHPCIQAIWKCPQCMPWNEATPSIRILCLVMHIHRCLLYSISRDALCTNLAAPSLRCLHNNCGIPTVMWFLCPLQSGDEKLLQGSGRGPDGVRHHQKKHIQPPEQLAHRRKKPDQSKHSMSREGVATQGSDPGN